MKKLFLSIFLITIIVLTTSCNKAELKRQKLNNDINNSERKQNIINLLKDKMIEKGYIIEDNLESLDILKVYIYGYNKIDSNKKDIEIDFKYTCKNDKNNCIQGLKYNGDNDFIIVWIYTDNEEKEIYDIKQGISINKTDIDSENYIRISELVE